MKSYTHNELIQKFSSYNDWKNCITELCGIPLTSVYIEERINQLNDRSNYHTEKFIEIWGESHLRQVIAWFEKARDEVN